MPRDPVCGMNVRDDKDAMKSDYGGGTYYFCSDKCKSEFDRNPQTYVSSTSENLDNKEKSPQKRRKTQ